ncbi:MAG: hypothetical protein LBR52_04710 [Prevotellaceae bacterium]|jgi:N-dimethylarginine dimethylaminohydrolase|nr:hypothetical protein [Prevotellaceae bacterium]
MNDLLTTETGDLLIRNGDLVIGHAQADIAERIVRAYPGEFKENPPLGCNAVAQLNGTPSPFWRGEVMTQLEAEGIRLIRLDITGTGVEIELEE